MGEQFEAALSYVFALLGATFSHLKELISMMGSAIGELFDGLQRVGDWVASALKVVGSAVWRGLKALVHLRFADIWKAIKRGFDRLKRAYRWYQDHVQAHIDRMRRQILDIYRRFFRPIINILEKMRRMVRVVAIFNRALAAKLDSALFNLESKVMFPITAMLKRVNGISSYIRALVTQAGLLDRVLLIESIRRDASIVWETITNPRGRIYEPIVHQDERPFAADVGDARVWLRTGGGPWTEEMDALRQSGRDLIADIGAL